VQLHLNTSDVSCEFKGMYFARIPLSFDLLMATCRSNSQFSHPTLIRIGAEPTTSNGQATGTTTTPTITPTAHLTATSTPAQTTTPTQHQTSTSAMPTPVPIGHVSTDANAVWPCVAVSMFLKACSWVGMYFYHFPTNYQCTGLL